MSVCRTSLLVAVTLIFSIGLVMIFNTSSAEVLDLSLEKSTHDSLIKQILYAILGCGVGFVARSLGYHNLIKLSFPLLVFFSILLLLVLIPGVGIVANGSRRWLGLAGFTLQPSELVKLIIPLYFIHRSEKVDVSALSFLGFLKFIAFACVPMVLILFEPNNGTVGVMGVTLMALFLISGVKAKYWALPMACAVVVCGLAAYNMPYVAARIKVYRNPELDILGKGHQPHQAKIAAGSGELLGKGPGGSLQKLSYLPEAQNDYIAAIYAEEFGFVGILVLLSLYMVVSYCGFHIACHAPDRSGCYLATAITFLISFQAFLNLGVVSGLLPSTGLNLPFFSQGGTSLIANIIGLSLLFDIAKRGEQALKKDRSLYTVVNQG